MNINTTKLIDISYFILLIFLISTNLLCGAQKKPLEAAPLGDRLRLAELDYFKNGSPRVVTFRNDFMGDRSTEFLRATVLQSSGHGPKVFDEERPQSVSNLVALNALATEHPELLLFTHWNAACIRADSQLNRHFSAAHWLYYPGGVTMKAISSTDEWLDVNDGKLFRTNLPPWQRPWGPVGYEGPGKNNDVITIVPMQDGQLAWADAECAVILEIDGNRIRIARGVFGTTPRAFASGALVAPLALRGGYEGPGTFRHFNYSLDAPRDEKGQNMSDAKAEMFLQWFHPGGPLEKFHGVLTDVLHWSLGPEDATVFDDNIKTSASKERLADTNLDGHPDNGYDQNGVNRFALGVYEAVKKFRQVMGPERIFLADGNGPRWARTPFQNGMESEGLTWHRDYHYRLWSSNINIWNFLRGKTADPYFSLIVTKVFLPEDTPDKLAVERERIRLAWAVATILDIAVTSGGIEDTAEERAFRVYDEATRGVDDVRFWLGSPISPVLRPALESPDLLKGAGVTMTPEFASRWSPTNAHITVDDRTLAIAPSENARPSENMKISFAGLQIPEGDIVIRFEVKMDSLKDFPTDTYRYMTVRLNGRKNVIQAQNRRHTEIWQNLYGVANGKGFHENVFFFTQAGPTKSLLELEFEGSAPVKIRNFTMHSAADILARQFEGGAVLANPSDAPVEVNLATLFPGTKYRRIQGHQDDPSPAVNNGQPVGDRLILPSLSGLFLVRQE